MSADQEPSTTARAGEWTEEQLIADVEAGPRGPRVGAFFDFDGTVIDELDAASRRENVGVQP